MLEVFIDDKDMQSKINERHVQLEEQIFQKNENAILHIVQRRKERDRHFRESNPALFTKIEAQHLQYLKKLHAHSPKLAKKIAELIEIEQSK